MSTHDDEIRDRASYYHDKGSKALNACKPPAARWVAAEMLRRTIVEAQREGARLNGVTLEEFQSALEQRFDLGPEVEP